MLRTGPGQALRCELSCCSNICRCCCCCSCAHALVSLAHCAFVATSAGGLDVSTLHQAMALIGDRKVETEASGNVTLETVRWAAGVCGEVGTRLVRQQTTTTTKRRLGGVGGGDDM
jgi:hypothetical protein